MPSKSRSTAHHREDRSGSEAQLAALGFEVKPEQQASDSIDPGRVINRPARGREGREGAAIKLLCPPAASAPELPT